SRNGTNRRALLGGGSPLTAPLDGLEGLVDRDGKNLPSRCPLEDRANADDLAVDRFPGPAPGDDCSLASPECQWTEGARKCRTVEFHVDSKGLAGDADLAARLAIFAVIAFGTSPVRKEKLIDGQVD